MAMKAAFACLAVLLPPAGGLIDSTYFRSSMLTADLRSPEAFTLSGDFVTVP